MRTHILINHHRSMQRNLHGVVFEALAKSTTAIEIQDQVRSTSVLFHRCRLCIFFTGAILFEDFYPHFDLLIFVAIVEIFELGRVLMNYLSFKLGIGSSEPDHGFFHGGFLFSRVRFGFGSQIMREFGLFRFCFDICALIYVCIYRMFCLIDLQEADQVVW